MFRYSTPSRRIVDDLVPGLVRVAEEETGSADEQAPESVADHGSQVVEKARMFLEGLIQARLVGESG